MRAVYIDGKSRGKRCAAQAIPREILDLLGLLIGEKEASKQVIRRYGIASIDMKARDANCAPPLKLSERSYGCVRADKGEGAFGAREGERERSAGGRG